MLLMLNINDRFLISPVRSSLRDHVPLETAPRPHFRFLLSPRPKTNATMHPDVLVCFGWLKGQSSMKKHFVGRPSLTLMSRNGP